MSCSLDTPRLAPTSTGLLFLLIHKAILFYQKFGLIYIHKHIYQHLYLQCYYTRNPAAPTYAFFVNFIWLKNTHKGVKGALGAINDCALGNPWKKISVKWALTQREGCGRAGSQQSWRQCEQDLCSEGRVCVCVCVFPSESQKARGRHSQDDFRCLPHYLSQSTDSDSKSMDQQPSRQAGSQGPSSQS